MLLSYGKMYNMIASISLILTGTVACIPSMRERFHSENVDSLTSVKTNDLVN